MQRALCLSSPLAPDTELVVNPEALKGFEQGDIVGIEHGRCQGYAAQKIGHS